MFKNVSRWSWLTLFALGNLLLWVLVAAAIGLMATDRVDLGVETFVRRSYGEYRATAIAVWKQAAAQIPFPAGPTAGPTARAIADNPGLRPTRASAVANTPAAAIAWPDTPPAQPIIETRSGQEVGQEPIPTPPLPAETLTPDPAATPTATPVRSPLLIANPEFKNLDQMDAEMSRSAVGRPVQIRYQETALNQEIAALVENNPKLPYHNVRVDLKPDRVIVKGNATVLGFPVGTEVVGRLAVKNCALQVEIEQISIAGVLTPGFVKDQIKSMVIEAATWYPSDYPLCLEQIVLGEERATVYGTRR
jgi:hypothetical protein